MNESKSEEGLKTIQGHYSLGEKKRQKMFSYVEKIGNFLKAKEEAVIYIKCANIWQI